MNSTVAQAKLLISAVEPEPWDRGSVGGGDKKIAEREAAFKSQRYMWQQGDSRAWTREHRYM